jgi:hypothetical protein
MKFILILAIFIVGCSNTAQSYDSEGYKQYCNTECHKSYGTDVDWIGPLWGKCYCK